MLARSPLQTLCVRHEPAGLEGDALDRHTQAWGDRVNRSGAAYLTPAMLDGRWMVRVSIGAIATERAHVEALWDRDDASRPEPSLGIEPRPNSEMEPAEHSEMEPDLQVRGVSFRLVQYQYAGRPSASRPRPASD